MIELWELGGVDDRRYSTFSWRTRWALRHKGLEFTTRTVNQVDKPAIAFSGGTTVPIIRDGDTVVRDSWQIAEYLERSYPQRPSLFGGGQGPALSQFFNTWVDYQIVPAAFAVLSCDAIHIQNPADRPYFAGLIERLTGLAPAELKLHQPENVERLHKAVAPVRALLRRQPFICGAQAGYSDYVLGSVYQWARIVSTVRLLERDPALSAWLERMLDLHNGFARQTTLVTAGSPPS